MATTTATTTNTPAPDQRLDLVLGAKGIADTLGISVRQAKHLISRGLLPVGRLGGHLATSKFLLAQAIANALAAAAAPDGDGGDA
jgi:hypothetical protein